VLFNEPKLLKYYVPAAISTNGLSFSALQRAEIAEIDACVFAAYASARFSALQRAEIAEIAAATPAPRDDQAFQCSSTSRNC